MAVFVVTWNLNKERANYDAARKAFVEHIEKFTHTKDGALETVRWVATDWTAAEVKTYLRQKLDDNDRLFVTRVRANENSGWLSKAVWEWIAART